jgi:hypothetical protein
MRNLAIVIGLLLVAVFTAGYRYSTPSPKGPLEGAWKLVGDQSGFVLFTEGHYSWMVINQPREQFADPGNPTDAEWLAACQGITANSGTYEVSGSAVRLRILAAKHPNAMAAQQVATFEYSIEADTLRAAFGGNREWLFVRVE